CSFRVVSAPESTTYGVFSASDDAGRMVSAPESTTYGVFPASDDAGRMVSAPESTTYGVFPAPDDAGRMVPAPGCSDGVVSAPGCTFRDSALVVRLHCWRSEVWSTWRLSQKNASIFDSSILLIPSVRFESTLKVRGASCRSPAGAARRRLLDPERPWRSGH
ncbi:hypothetical protein BC828DRAFT_393860, partial [Blastocladiella britannica]